MPGNGMTPLTAMRDGQTARVVQIQGGRGMLGHLDALGIRVGVQLTKVSSQFMRGPVVVQSGNTQVAIGFGMASKILVEVTP
jgi:ferrous iron transport protein A